MQRESDAKLAGNPMEGQKTRSYHYQDGAMSYATNGHSPLTLKELAAKLPLAKNGHRDMTSVTVTTNNGGVAPAFTTHRVDVEVDLETGKVDVLRYTAVQDVGHRHHPSYVEGQIQGGVDVRR